MSRVTENKMPWRHDMENITFPLMLDDAAWKTGNNSKGFFFLLILDF